MKTDNDKQPDAPDSARRNLLKAVPLGALAVAAAARARAPETAAPAAPAQPQRAQGYHETEHIRHYYRTAAYW